MILQPLMVSGTQFAGFKLYLVRLMMAHNRLWRN